nr:axoneme-associated protein mst101(2)-like [Syngnathus scovelli]
MRREGDALTGQARCAVCALHPENVHALRWEGTVSIGRRAASRRRHAATTGRRVSPCREGTVLRQESAALSGRHAERTPHREGAAPTVCELRREDTSPARTSRAAPAEWAEGVTRREGAALRRHRAERVLRRAGRNLCRAKRVTQGCQKVATPRVPCCATPTESRVDRVPHHGESVRHGATRTPRIEGAAARRRRTERGRGERAPRQEDAALRRGGARAACAAQDTCAAHAALRWQAEGAMRQDGTVQQGRCAERVLRQENAASRERCVGKDAEGPPRGHPRTAPRGRCAEMARALHQEGATASGRRAQSRGSRSDRVLHRSAWALRGRRERAPSQCPLSAQALRCSTLSAQGGALSSQRSWHSAERELRQVGTAPRELACSAERMMRQKGPHAPPTGRRAVLPLR